MFLASDQVLLQEDCPLNLHALFVCMPILAPHQLSLCRASPLCWVLYVFRYDASRVSLFQSFHLSPLPFWPPPCHMVRKLQLAYCAAGSASLSLVEYSQLHHPFSLVPFCVCSLSHSAHLDISLSCIILLHNYLHCMRPGCPRERNIYWRIKPAAKNNYRNSLLEGPRSKSGW